MLEERTPPLGHRPGKELLLLGVALERTAHAPLGYSEYDFRISHHPSFQCNLMGFHNSSAS